MIDCLSREDKNAYIQCELYAGAAGTYQTAWIPAKHASMGEEVMIREGQRTWTGPWTVVNVYPHKRIGVADTRKAIRGHRKRTGDSLRKS